MDSCKSCSHKRSTDALYCTHCGAKFIEERLSLSRLGRDFLKLITNLEGPFISTIKNLITVPNKVTIAYVDGVRKSIISPLRSATIALTVYGVFQFLFQDFFDQIVVHNNIDALIQSVSEGVGKGISDGAFGSTSEVVDNLDASTINITNTISQLLQKHSQFTNFFVIPVLAFICKVTYDHLDYNYAEHLSIAIYAISLSLLISTTGGFIFGLFNTDWATSVYGSFTFFVNVIIVIRVLWKSYGGAISNAIGSFFLSYIAFAILIFLSVSILFSIG